MDVRDELVRKVGLKVAVLVDRRALELSPIVLLLLVRQEPLELILAENLLAIVDVAFQGEVRHAVLVVALDIRHGQLVLALRALNVRRVLNGGALNVLYQVVGEIGLKVALGLDALEGAPGVLELHVILQGGPHFQPQAAPGTYEPLAALLPDLGCQPVV